MYKMGVAPATGLQMLRHVPTSPIRPPPRKCISNGGYTSFTMPVHMLLAQVCCILLLSASPATAKDIWHVSIFQGPAPPPGKGPPIQASALRDKSYLPVQIGSIVAAYVISVLVIGSALLFVGRRLRRSVQASSKTLSMEMMKPVKAGAPKAFDQSPVSHGASPASAVDTKNHWPSPIRGMRGSGGWGSIKKGHKKQASESQASVVTFDDSVVEDDKARNEREMERLYAAVMEDEERRSTSKVNLTGLPQPQYPPELQHLQDDSQPSAPPRTDTRSPGRSIPSRPRTSSRPTPLSINSMHSHNSSRSSFSSLGKKHGIRGLPISPPMGSPGLAPDYDDGYGDNEPLSPRYYPDPGPPPPTPDEHSRATRYRHERTDNNHLSPRDARFPMASLRKTGGAGSVPPSPTVQTIPEVPSHPELATRNGERSITGSPSPRKQPPPLALRTHTTTITAGTGNHHPLRSAPLPLRNAHPTNYNHDRPMPSPAIKNTVLEQRSSAKGLQTPGTGVPYSPYMPFTPLTPVTPSRLVTKGERKRREKEEGRRVPTIDDAVEEEADMWGDAYP